VSVLKESIGQKNFRIDSCFLDEKIGKNYEKFSKEKKKSQNEGSVKAD